MLAKAVSCAIPVVKADDNIQGRGIHDKLCTKGDKYSVATNGPFFGKSICYLSVGLYVWKNDTAKFEK